jgi:L,D-transpeptidase catalytic domain
MTGPKYRGQAALPPALTSFVIVLFASAWTGAGAGAVAPGTGADTVPEKGAHELALLLRPHMARSAPDERSVGLRLVGSRRPLTGERTVLPVLGHRTDADGRRWLRVGLPGRPNGHTGWIRQRSTVSSTTSWHVVVDLSMRRTIVYNRGRAARFFRAIVGKPSTPTPTGEFFVEESIQMRRGDPGAPYALALSARSNVLQEFDGGPGQIALHGLGNIGGELGSAVSHGCVRLDNEAMRWLVLRIRPGVRVRIQP